MSPSFWKAGHAPTLFAAFLYFDLSFMVWYVLGPMAVQIATDLQLTTQQRSMMVATPILAGAVLRLILGFVADRLSPKTAGIIGQVVVILALLVAWQHGVHSYEQTLVLGLFLGFAGASFAVALPLASQWYPPQHQGKALGIAGAGNSGTVFAALFAPARRAGPRSTTVDDCCHPSVFRVLGRGAVQAMQAALRASGLQPGDIGYLNLHGTATPHNDAMESQATHQVFPAGVPCSSTKPLTGHTLGAAGALEAAFAWLTLDPQLNPAGQLPPQRWDGQADPALPRLALTDADSRLDGRRHAMSNSFAFGGSNVSLILGATP